jgi:hypothetical protein
MIPSKQVIGMSTLSNYLDQLVRETHKSEAEIMALAIEAGMRQLWREQVLGRYLRGDLSRQQAVEAVGADWVDLAERQHRAMREDVEWARDPSPSP